MDSEQPPVATLAASIRLNNMLAIIAWSLLFYDYCLTLGIEIEHFWKRARVSAVSTLFVLNRYLSLLGQIPIIVEYFVILPPLLQMYHQFYAILNQAIVGLILIFRTYALYNRNKYVMMGLVALGLALVAATLISGNVKTTPTGSDVQSDEPSLVGCNHSMTAEQGNAVGWIAMICMDTTIFILTLVKTIRVRNHMHHGVQRVLFRDVSVLMIAGAANLLTFVQIDDTVRGMGTTLTNALSTTLISRVCLNLRDPSLHCSGDGRRTDGLWTPADSTSTTTAGRTTSLMPSFACPEATTQTIESDIVLVSISHESAPHDGLDGA
ncbi:hypothetical protein LXA43DRAFT_995301 [Ganoderma leucocontextum]|nr:hypothetical protein LXA43DRAFT_995301 [Ganoderma leucocontextum]